jgi:hypothetical protein
MSRSRSSRGEPVLSTILRTRPAAAVSIAIATTAAAAPAVSAVTAGSALPVGRQVLSNERTLSFWAHAVVDVPVRAAPRRGARIVARLRFLNEDGLPEIYLVLRRATFTTGATWLQVRLPMRPNGRAGWVPEGSLGPMHAVRTRLVVDRRRLRATLYRRGRPVWSSPVGIGKAGTPTPAGRFYIRDRLTSLSPFYGPFAFATSAYSRLSDWPGGGVVGIHGTTQPELIPGRPSHGCIRVPNAAIRRLARLMPLGTPVLIR